MIYDNAFPSVVTGVSEETAVSFFRTELFTYLLKVSGSVFFRNIDAYL